MIKRCREKRLPLRKVAWADGGARRDRAAHRQWLEARWLVPAAGSDLVIVTPLPQSARRLAIEALEWWVATAGAFGRLVGQSVEGSRSVRPVRFVVVEEESAAHPLFPQGWMSLSHRQTVEVRFQRDRSVHLEADGMLAVVLAYFARRTAGATLHWVHPLGKARVVCTGDSGEAQAAQLIVATALWWRFAGFESIISTLTWFVEAAPKLLRQDIEAHPLIKKLAPKTVESLILEARLRQLWPLASFLDTAADAEEEVEGWCRELEAAYRQTDPPLSPTAPAPGGMIGTATTLQWPPSRSDRRSLEFHASYIAAMGREQAGAWLRIPGLSRHGLERFFALADGERTLAEMALRLSAEFGLEWEFAVDLLKRLVHDGKLVALERSLNPRTLLYFSYGSCMCRPSFRETIPKFELIGEAVLKDYRLGFTHRSTVRGGGVADIVPEPGSEVRGILYRVPRVDLPELDEREGVSFGHYQREWVGVEALGVRFDLVLTYTVVNKAPKDIRPSEEYAGLIIDGAKGMLSPKYVTELEMMLEELGVEPEIPL